MEIERKFLVISSQYRKEAKKQYKIAQGFLNTHPSRTVRVRIKDRQGYLTVKGMSNDSGTSRFEWEQQIGVEDAQQLLALCEPGLIEKRRYEIPIGNHIFEVDDFLGDNEGLVIAEVELKEEEENFLKPEWLGEEVTGDIKYYNSQLSKNPYKTWKN